MRHKRRVSLSVMVAIGMFAPINLYAFGLGPITLHSALNQPFDAEIEVTSLRETEKGNLEVRLASVADFERAGLDRNFLLTQFDFEVIERGDGAIVRITTNAPVREPFLDFLLSASAGEGRLIRSYTVLLDPPTEIYQRRTQTAPAQRSSSPTAAAPTTAQPQTRSAPASAQSPYDGSRYRVQRNDTLWKIAQRVRASDAVSVQQMMLALFEENPQAFQNNNMNSLLANAVLTVPDSARATQTNQREVIAQINQQIAAWEQRQSSTTPAITTEPEDEVAQATPEEQTEASVPADVDTSVAETDLATELAEQVAEDAARLKLVTADESGDQAADPMMVGDPEIQKLSEQLTLAQETIESQTQENIDFKSRMDAMEAQLETMRRLLSLKDADMARLQQILEQQGRDITDAEALAIIAGEGDYEAEGVFDAETSAQQALDADVLSIQMDSPEAEPVLFDAEQADAALSADPETSITEPAMDEAMVMSDADLTDAYENASIEFAASTDNDSGQVVTEEAQPSMLSQISAIVSRYTMELLLAALLVLLLLVFVIRQRNKPQQWQQAARKNASLNNTTVATAAVVESDMTVETEVPKEESVQAIPERSTEALVEQADMFVGYADYVQAKQALDQAYLQQPEDKQIATKLLYVLFKQQKSADFLSVLSESDIDSDDSQWTDIAAWGHELMPNNALFFADETPEEQPEVNMAEDDSSADVPVIDAETESTKRPDAADDDSPIEFNLEDYAPAGSDQEDTEESYSPDTSEFLDFEQTVDKTHTAEDEQADFAAFETDNLPADDTRHTHHLNDMVEAGDTDILDLTDSITSDDDNIAVDTTLHEFELDNDDTDEASDIEEELSPRTLDLTELDAGEESDLDFDLGDFDEIDEAETKLDLAHAYIDMGDPEGARGILEEVLNEGSEEQQHRAQSLIDSLA